LSWEEPLGFISLITWEESSLRGICEDTDLSESSEGEEGAVAASFFNLLLVWEYFTSEWLGEYWTMGFKGGGAGKDMFG
jgi:hypothetical protein